MRLRLILPVAAVVALAGLVWFVARVGTGDPVPSAESGSAAGGLPGSASPSAPASPPEEVRPPAPPTGEALYAAHCLNCHGPEGEGDGPLAASLGVRPANIQEHMDHHTEEELGRFIRDGIPPWMPGAPIGPEDLGRLVRYLLGIPEPAEGAAR